MFFKKKNNLEISPLGYWEEKSYMILIPKDVNNNPLDGLFEKVEKVKDLKIIKKEPLTATDPGYLKVSYENEEYELVFYPSPFEFNEFLINKNFYFEESEVEQLKKADRALNLHMKFKGNAKKCYHLQIKIAHAIMPDLLALFDESAERLVPAKWVELTAKSNVLPSASSLYVVQAVMDDDSEVWLHTHGLCRCGLTELEILQSDKNNYNNHYNLISTYASYLIDKGEDYDPTKNSAYIGVLSDNSPVVVTCRLWNQALNEYKQLKLGSIPDRKEGHNSKTSIIFLYKSEYDENNNILSKVSDYNNLWGDNPIFFLSNEETQRMKALAIERFNYVKEQFKNKDNTIIIKVGLPTSDNNTSNLEHIWFELLELKKDTFKAKLTQEPYNIPNVHEGDIMTFKINDITDWIIYTKDITITSENVYLLK